MSFPVLLADITLIVQIAAFVILLFGIMHVKKKDFSKHFKTADIAVILGITAFLWMGYSFLNNSRAFISNPASPITLLTLFHSVVGSMAILGGSAFVSSRLIKKTLVPMRLVFLVWMLALLLGTAMYITVYVF